MGKVLAVTNRKGGTGKTMTSVSLGVSLVRQGKKVLLIDADSQHSATVSLGVKEPDKLEVSLATIMQGIIREQGRCLVAKKLYHKLPYKTKKEKRWRSSPILCRKVPSGYNRPGGFRSGTARSAKTKCRKKPPQRCQDIRKQNKMRRLRQLVRLEGVALE